MEVVDSRVRLSIAAAGSEMMDVDSAGAGKGLPTAAMSVVESDSDVSSDSEEDAMEQDVLAEIRARLAEPVEDMDDAAAASGSLLVRWRPCGPAQLLQGPCLRCDVSHATRLACCRMNYRQLRFWMWKLASRTCCWRPAESRPSWRASSWCRRGLCQPPHVPPSLCSRLYIAWHEHWSSIELRQGTCGACR